MDNLNAISSLFQRLQEDNQLNEHQFSNSINQYDQILNNSNLKKSKVFKQQDCTNSIFFLLAIFIDLILGILALLVYNKDCPRESSNELKIWNFYSIYFLFGKAAYNFLISLQLISSKEQRKLCLKIGHLKTEEENIQYETYFKSLHIKNQQIIRGNIDLQILYFYYQRNKFLKIIFYIKVFTTIGMTIYGLAAFFQGDFQYLLFHSSEFPQRQCEVSLAWFSYISFILVFSSYRDFFILTTSLIIMIPILILIVMPYKLVSKYQYKKKRESAFSKLLTIKYKIENVQGDSECSICKMDFQIDEEVTIMPCSSLHYYHKSCIEKWLEVRDTCPICRYDFSKNKRNERRVNQIDNNNFQAINNT